MRVISFNTFTLHFLRKWARGDLMYAKLYFAGFTQQSSVTSDSCVHYIYLHQGNAKQCVFITPPREQQQQVIFLCRLLVCNFMFASLNSASCQAAVRFKLL